MQGQSRTDLASAPISPNPNFPRTEYYKQVIWKQDDDSSLFIEHFRQSSLIIILWSFSQIVGPPGGMDSVDMMDTNGNGILEKVLRSN